jgi:hypothetical protein
MSSALTGAAGTASSASQSITGLTPGNVYHLEFTAASITAGSFTPYLGGTAGTTITANGTYDENIIAGSDSLLLEFIKDADFVGTIDDVALHVAIVDFSANEVHLHPVGTITKTAVNTGAGLVAYSGFTTSNYIQQEYNAALDFGTGDFSVSFWINEDPNTASECIFDRADPSPAQEINAVIGATGFLSFNVSDGTTDRVVTSTSAIDDLLWHYVVLNYDASAGYLSIHIDGALNNSDTGTVLNTLSDASAILNIGLYADGTTPLTNGSICIFKMDNALKTPAKIKEHYNNEKGLFKYGAPYSVKDAQYTIEIPLLNSSGHGYEDYSYQNETIDQTRETLFHSSKKTWSTQGGLVPYTSSTETDLFDIKHFINSAKRGQTITLDERGDGLDDELVILDSKNSNFDRDGSMVDYYKVNLNFKEA